MHFRAHPSPQQSGKRYGVDAQPALKMMKCLSKARKKFDLEYDRPEHFLQTQGRWPSLFYLIYNTVWMLYIPAWLIAEGVSNFHLKYIDDVRTQQKFFIYFTNWSYTVLSLTVVTRGILSCVYYRRLNQKWQEYDGKGGRFLKEMPIGFKFLWILYNVALPSEILVGLGFYGHYLACGGTPDQTTPVDDPMSIHLHGIGPLYIVIDLFVSAIPLKTGHFFHAMIYYALYVTFSYIYYVCGGTNKSKKPWIYSQLNWSETMTPLYATLAVILVPIFMWGVLYLLYKLRVTVYSRCSTNQDPAVSQSSERFLECGSSSGGRCLDSTSSDSIGSDQPAI